MRRRLRRDREPHPRPDRADREEHQPEDQAALAEQQADEARAHEDPHVDQQPLRRLQRAAGPIQTAGDPVLEALVPVQDLGGGVLRLGQGRVVLGLGRTGVPSDQAVGVDRGTLLGRHRRPLPGNEQHDQQDQEAQAQRRDAAHHPGPADRQAPVGGRRGRGGRGRAGLIGAANCREGLRGQGGGLGGQRDGDGGLVVGDRVRQLGGDEDLAGEDVRFAGELLAQGLGIGRDDLAVAGVGQLLESGVLGARAADGHDVDEHAVLGHGVRDVVQQVCRWCRGRRRARGGCAGPRSPPCRRHRGPRRRDGCPG